VTPINTVRRRCVCVCMRMSVLTYIIHGGGGEGVDGWWRFMCMEHTCVAGCV
jgi:hypothetical protein